MRNFTIATSLTVGLFCSIAALQPAKAADGVVKAIVVLEAVGGEFDAVQGKLGGLSLSNCLHLVEAAFKQVLIVEIACNEPKDIPVAIANHIVPIEGVSRMTTWVVKAE